MGLAFKPDLREAPALYIAKTLKDQGFAVEPNISSHKELEKAINDADVVVGHKIFGKEVIDFCGITNEIH